LQKRATLPPKEGAVPTLTHDAGKDEIEHSANDRNHHRAPLAVTEMMKIKNINQYSPLLWG
jgi:hypothetical protein